VAAFDARGWEGTPTTTGGCVFKDERAACTSVPSDLVVVVVPTGCPPNRWDSMPVCWRVSSICVCVNHVWAFHPAGGGRKRTPPRVTWQDDELALFYTRCIIPYCIQPAARLIQGVG
jgi:hypothetical protein